MSERSRETIRVEDLLTAYAMGLLDAADTRRVEDALAADPDLLDQLYDEAPVDLAIAAEPGRLAAAGRRGLAASTPGVMERVAAWLHDLWTPKVAAPVLTLAFALALVLIPGADGKFRHLADLTALDYAHVEVRSAPGTADDLFTAAMDAYLDGRWLEAASGLDDALGAADADAWSRRDQALLYQGSALLLGGRADAALTPLTEASASSLPPVRERARWQAVQARLVTGDADGARADLEGLTSSPVYGPRAAALLEELAGLTP